MNPIKLQLTNLKQGTNFVQVGIPLPKGAQTDCSQLNVITVDDTAADVQCSFAATARWSDGTIKWGLAKISITNNHSADLELVLLQGVARKLQTVIEVTENSETIKIKASAATFEFHQTGTFPTVTYEGGEVWRKNACHPVLKLNDDSLCQLQINDVSLIDHDNLSCKVQICGQYQIDDNHLLNARFIFEVLPDAELSLICELHNPQRALHAGGIWDLGDPGSVTFKDFSIAFDYDDQSEQVQLQVSKDAEWINASQSTILFQAASGGKHWDNAVHVNAEGKVCNKFNGYQLTVDNNEVVAGDRSSPMVALQANTHAFTVEPLQFWENFPKSIDVSATELALRLFPYHHGDRHEIQGGERKRHQVLFNFARSHKEITATAQSTAPQIRLPAEVYKQAGVFNYLDDSHTCPAYDALIEPSRDPQTGFYAKRENLDEYGWRNFGDIHADHEAAHHKDEHPFVSHYNNQYDALYGFIRQFVISGDFSWQPLYSDLANHLMDIDIYRTEEDRVEYNNGMFWHTDHYMQAQTASHRTYSKSQVHYDGQPQIGGGPSSGHSYSTGLVYYYFMTGDQEAKSTVLDLGDWIVNYQEGSGTLLETTRKTLQHDTANFIKTCKGAKIFRYRYPMDRETGNYMRTLMDCYDLTADSSYLNKIEKIIRNTAGPGDDINARGFDDVEQNWYYVVFLQELVRYLDLKRSIDQQDKNFYYARATLLHYARWMAANEAPYLESAENLEYPNATWIAQEPRKVHVFYAAYKYALNNRSVFLERARFFNEYLTRELAACDTLHFARIQILLLQNHGPATALAVDSLPYPGIREVDVTNKDGCFHTPKTHLQHITGNWVTCLTNFRISKELRWIRSRAS